MAWHATLEAWVLTTPLSIEVIDEASATRELDAFTLFLENLLQNSIWHSRHVYWFSDSAAACGALRNWRSGSMALTGVLIRLWNLCKRYKITVTPTWISRSFGYLPAADFLSRVAGRWAQADWSVARRSFEDICQYFRVNPVVDLFASNSNRRTRRYYAKCPESGSLGPWDERVWIDWRPSDVTWAYPPYSTAARMLRSWIQAPSRPWLLALVPADLVVWKDARLEAATAGKRDWSPGWHLLDARGRRAMGPPPTRMVVVLLRGGQTPLTR
jgi:hypothetical protein